MHGPIVTLLLGISIMLRKLKSAELQTCPEASAVMRNLLTCEQMLWGSLCVEVIYIYTHTQGISLQYHSTVIMPHIHTLQKRDLKIETDKEGLNDGFHSTEQMMK